MGMFVIGVVLLLIFCSETKLFSRKESSSDQVSGDYVFMLEAHEVTGGIHSVPVSPVEGERTKIGFVNRMNFPVQVHWVDHNGTLHYFTPLGENFGMNTKAFVGQTWLVSDGNRTPLFYYFAEKMDPDGAFGKASITRA
jgi:hypothetical protein